MTDENETKRQALDDRLSGTGSPASTQATTRPATTRITAHRCHNGSARNRAPSSISPHRIITQLIIAAQQKGSSAVPDNPGAATASDLSDIRQRSARPRPHRPSHVLERLADRVGAVIEL